MAADLLVENHGTIFLLQPMTHAAHAWIVDSTSDDAQWFAGALVVEHRYVGAIVEGAIDAGLVVA